MCSSGIDCLDVRTGKCRKVRVFEQTPCGTQQVNDLAFYLFVFQSTNEKMHRKCNALIHHSLPMAPTVVGAIWK